MLLSGKLNIFQTDYFIQTVVNSMNNRPLCIINHKIISPCYIQNLLFHRAYQEDLLTEMTHLSQEERSQKFKHLLDHVHYLLDLLHITFAEETIPTLLNCKRVSSYRNKLYGLVHLLEGGCLIFDPKTYC